MEINDLNAAIAERVMGWTDICGSGVYTDSSCHFTKFSVAEPTGALGSHWQEFVKWNPCEDWGHFGLVLRRIWEQNWGVMLRAHKDPSYDVMIEFNEAGDYADSGNCMEDGPLVGLCAAILDIWKRRQVEPPKETN